MRPLWRVMLLLVPILVWSAAVSGFSFAEDNNRSGSNADPNREIEEIKREIRRLQQRVDELEAQGSRLQRTNSEIKARDEKLQAGTTQQFQSLQAQMASPNIFRRSHQSLSGHLSLHAGGWGGGSFIYDRQSNINTFALDLEPIILWRLNDRMLFEGTIQANLPSGSDAEFQLPVATLQYFLNDYSELVLGIFDQPFGDWYEDQSPFWVNRFITVPLPYGANPLVPPTDVGVQLRGGFQWGGMGQVADYTVWAANGPGFTQATCADNTRPSPLPSCAPVPLVGDTLVEVNNIHLNTHTPAFGARIRIYPLPVDSNLGRLEVGASS